MIRHDVDSVDSMAQNRDLQKNGEVLNFLSLCQKKSEVSHYLQTAVIMLYLRWVR